MCNLQSNSQVLHSAQTALVVASEIASLKLKVLHHVDGSDLKI